MEIEWRTVQMFLDKDNPDEGISEVSVDDHNPKKVRCSCRKFKMTARCKHAQFVKDKIKNSDGIYSIRVPEEVSDEEAIDSLADIDLFRDFVIKYGEVVVI